MTKGFWHLIIWTSSSFCTTWTYFWRRFVCQSLKNLDHQLLFQYRWPATVHEDEKLQLGISVQSTNGRGWNALKIVWTCGSMISNNPWWSSAFAWDHIRACLLCVATTVDDQQTFACTLRLIRPDGLLTERKREANTLLVLTHFGLRGSFTGRRP